MGLSVALFKAIFVPIFLSVICRRINVLSDSTIFLPAPICMHIGIALLGVGYLISAQMPGVIAGSEGRIGATAAFSLIFGGVLMMLTRKAAISQILGFLVIENGIYLFGLSETHGMPMMVEMGILLDLLVGVMIGGLLLLRIKKNFEHIDVTQLTTLRD
jgi:hydrogenase-4 component E